MRLTGDSSIIALTVAGSMSCWSWQRLYYDCFSIYLTIMSLTSVSKIAFELQNQPGWEGIRDWGLIVKAWLGIVSPAIAERTQPRSISRDILTIATNSSSLAHQLTFSRQALCLRLNTQLVVPIADLRFVTAGYHHRSTPTPIDSQSLPIDSGEIVICSHCHCRARQGELHRWGVCQFCALDLGIIGGKSTFKS